MKFGLWTAGLVLLVFWSGPLTALADDGPGRPSPLGVNAAFTDFRAGSEGGSRSSQRVREKVVPASERGIRSGGNGDRHPSERGVESEEWGEKKEDTEPVPVSASAGPSQTPSRADAVPLDRDRLVGSVQTVVLFGLVSMVPVAVLMLSAFVRISIVLTLLRQALGSPQVPGNQVLLALSLLLTAVVMAPVGQKVYEEAVEPFADGRLDASSAWKAGTEPVKAFMCGQILKTRHEKYLWTLYARAVPDSDSRPEPTDCMEFPLRVVAPAFLLSELTTALFMGFLIYLPFLVTDLVVSAVLSAMGLFMLPPSLVALPVKLVLFVLADGWLLVADMLLRSFA